jgi:hypothetical protein
MILGYRGCEVVHARSKFRSIHSLNIISIDITYLNCYSPF